MKPGTHHPTGVAIRFDDVHLLAAARTAFGKLTGTLARVSPTDLGIFAAKAAIERSGLSASQIQQVIVSNITQSSIDAYFMPRHLGLYAGAPFEAPTLLVQRLCASGFEVLVTAAEQITLGKGEILLAAAAENMSLSPTVSYGNRMGYALGQVLFQDFLFESLKDTAVGGHMGCTAETLVRQLGITRQQADEWALRSQQRATNAASLLAEEIAPVNSTVFERDGLKPRKVKLPSGVQDFRTDEHVRSTTLESLAKLPPAFENDGIHTAGNSSGIVDGAAAAMVVSGKVASATGIKPLARIVAAASAGVDPRTMGIGPVPAIRLLLEHTGMTLSQIGRIEINEAFAGQFLSCQKELELNPEICNVNGGAIALGHPLSASGLRLTHTLALEMNRSGVKYGIAAACVGGGQGTALLLEVS